MAIIDVIKELKRRNYINLSDERMEELAKELASEEHLETIEDIRAREERMGL